MQSSAADGITCPKPNCGHFNRMDAAHCAQCGGELKPLNAPATTSGEAVKGKLGVSFWLVNVIEMWERLAYYTLRPVAPIYIMQATEPGGLHLTAKDKGTIYLWWAVFQSIFPMVTGGYADRYGYKNMLAFSVTMNIIGYLTMAMSHSYAGFFIGVLLLAFGTAFFKPSIQATLGAQLTKENSSLGWGIFYWVVNVGSMIGHYISPFLLGNPHSADGWRTLFYACAGFTALNYVMLFTIPSVPSGAAMNRNPFQVFWHTIKNVFEPRLIVWILIMSCFWMMMYQLWDLQPNFIEDWVDSSMIAKHIPEKLTHYREIGDGGVLKVPQQILISLNSILIVALIIPVSWTVRKMRTLSAMFFGMVMSTIGVLAAGLTMNAWFLLLGIVGFSLGEMLTGPKKNEYLNLIAPPGKRGLYLGYVNIPAGIGSGVGAWIAGIVYGNYGEKAVLALRYLAEHTPLGQGKGWNGVPGTLEATLGVNRSEAFYALRYSLGMDAQTCTKLLWDTYHPQYYVWIPFAAIGVFAAIALAVFGQMAKRWSDMNA